MHQKIIFKKAPYDEYIQIPILANFYSFLAKVAEKETVRLIFIFKDNMIGFNKHARDDCS